MHDRELRRTVPRSVIEDICELLSVEADDVVRIHITPWRVEVTYGIDIVAASGTLLDPWADTRPDPFLDGPQP